MNNDGVRDLQWWHVPAWAHAAPRVIATVLAAGLAAGLAAWIVFGIAEELVFGVVDWLETGLLFGIMFGIMGGIAGGTMAWAHAAPRVIATGLVAGLRAGLVDGPLVRLGVALVAWLGARPGTGLRAGLVSGIVAGIAGGLMAALAFGNGNKIPRRIAPVRWRQLFRPGPLVAGLLVGIVAGGLTGLVEHYLTGFMAWFGVGLGVALVAWLGAGLIVGMSRPETDNASPLSPLPSRRSDQAFGCVVGLLVWLGVRLAFGVAYGIGSEDLPSGLADWIGSGLVAGLLVGFVSPQAWSSSLAFAQLAVSDRTPVRLMRFLEDARSRSVLRTLGPVYQFRHARLQDRLAIQETATGRNHGEPRTPTGDTAPPAVEAPSVSAN